MINRKEGIVLILFGDYVAPHNSRNIKDTQQGRFTSGYASGSG